MPRPRSSLRRTLTVTFVTVAALAAVISASLIVLSRMLEGTRDEVSDALEHVRLAEQAEIHLLSHARSSNPQEQVEAERQLVTALQGAKGFADDPEEARLVQQTVAAADQYLIAARTPSGGTAQLEQAIQHVEQLNQVNVEQARSARARAETVSVAATLIAVSGVFLLVAATAWLVWWLRSRALRPILGVVEGMRRFRAGERELALAEDGPKEIAEISAQFNEVAVDLRRQRDAQLSFLAGVAHDLRNPLNALKLAVGRLLRARPLPPEEQTRSVIERIERQLSRLERMVGDVMDASQIEAGRLTLKRSPHDLRRGVEDVVHLFAGTSERHDLRVTLPEQPVMIDADALRLEQVLTNLVSNAIKYSPEGGVVQIAVSSADGTARLTVQDRGIGIRAAEVPRLFEPFRRAGAAHDQDTIPGVGLGLYVVKRIVEAHGGKILVRTVEGEGTTFEVILPALEGAAEQPAPATH